MVHMPPSQGGGPRPFVKIAEDLGIEWHLIADGDQSGNQYANTAKQLLGASHESERITRLSQPDIEHTFWHAGYDALYENAGGPNQRRSIVTSAHGSPDYASQVIRAAIKTTSKPHMAYEVAATAAAKGAAGVPPELKIAIETAVRLAGRCA